MSITICNMHNGYMDKPYDVRVDRTSILGNPFPITNLKHRDVVCDQYADWFVDQLTVNLAFMVEIQRLLDLYRQHGQLRLFCWCAPRRCHAQTIKEYILAMGQNNAKAANYVHALDANAITGEPI